MNAPRTFKLASPGPGAYRVRLVGENPGQVAMATFAGPDDVQFVKLPPGAYTANVEPIGSATVTVQTIHLKAQRAPVRLHDDLDLQFVPDDTVAGLTFTDAAREATTRKAAPRPSARRAAVPEAPPGQQARAFSLGFSVDALPTERGGWRGQAPRLSHTDAEGGRLALQIRRPSEWRDLPRWRMTIALQDDRLWRIPLPLFKGGLQMTLSTVETPSGPDFTVVMAPRDPLRAALVASLEQFFDYSPAQMVQSGLPGGAGPPPPASEVLDLLAEQLDDPWAAAAAALAMIRSGDIEAIAPSVLRLHSRFPWLPDALVLKAWVEAWLDVANDAPTADSERRCLQGLQAARGIGVPYFAASEALALEMATGLALGGGRAIKAQGVKERDLWARRSRRRMPTGAYLSWEDWQGARSQGRLASTEYAVLLSGAILGDRIRVEGPVRKAARPAVGPPALQRPIRDPEDPMKGRFGRRARRDGFELKAAFGRGPDGWVEIALTVTGPAADGETVELFLHDSFHPDRVPLAFQGGVARYETLAYGGFTVGAWLADRDLELELDLSRLADAPRIIREL